MSVKRNYNYKDLHMLLACKAIVQSFSNNIDELSLVKPEWTSDYAERLSFKIDEAIENNLKIDEDRQVRDAYTTLNTMYIPAIRDISLFKQKVEGDYKDNVKKKKKLMKNLGFTDYLNNAQKKDQEALIKLLQSIEKNFKPKLRREFESKGVNSKLMDKVEQYAEEFRNIQLPKKIFDKLVKNPKDSSIEIFNQIYEEIQGICKVASAYYRFEADKWEQYAFQKIANNAWTIKSVATVK